METFPDLNFQFPFNVTPRWNTLENPFDSGVEQRRAKWTNAVYDVDLVILGLSLSDSQTMFSFYMARKGSYEAFYLYDKFIYSHQDIIIDTADGTEVTYDIPCDGVSGETVYFDGVSQDSSTYTILSGGGDGDSDRIQFNSAPPNGAVITMDFSGYLRMKCKFKDDKLTRNDFLPSRTNYTISLVGVK